MNKFIKFPCPIIRQKLIHLVNKLYSFAVFNRNRTLIQPIPIESDTVASPDSTTIDDRFNDVPIAVALSVLLAYISIGSVVVAFIEDWSLFEAGYFAFISFSTIGLGDYVPSQSLHALASIGYTVFGLALMSMCVSVMKRRWDGAMRRICSRLGRTIGLDVDDERRTRH